MTLWGPYLLGVEIAALLLLAGLVGAFNLAVRERRPQQTSGSETP